MAQQVDAQHLTERAWISADRAEDRGTDRMVDDTVLIGASLGVEADERALAARCVARLARGEDDRELILLALGLAAEPAAEQAEDVTPQCEEGEKYCPACGTVKRRAQFHVDSTRGDGRQSTCKPCHNAARARRKRASAA